jgi:hypothetical protein
MRKLRFRIAMSLDGFVAGPGQSVDNPLGTDRHGLALVRTVAAPGVTHLKFARA